MKICLLMQDSISVNGKYFRKYINEADIQARIVELGKALTQEYEGKNPLFVGVLNGGFLFAADLFRQFEFECEITFVKLTSYKGMSSTGNVNEVIGLDTDIRGRHVVVLEDIIDTGKTLYEFMPNLLEQGADSARIATLLHKPDALKFDVKIDYIGFSVPNKFLVGYGLDFDQKGRNYRDIYQLDE